MIVKVKFHLIRINTVASKLEIVFPYGEKWYRMDWENVPDKYKTLYTAYIKMLGREVPDYLKDYEKTTIELDNLEIELELDLAEEVPPTYPLGV